MASERMTAEERRLLDLLAAADMIAQRQDDVAHGGGFTVEATA
jgi:hypothetical protein